MAEIDMIPRSYHEAQRIRTALRRFALTLAVLAALGALAFGGLRWRLAIETPVLARLRAATEQGAIARRQQETLQLQKAALDQRLAVLTALRGAGDVGRALGAIDAALSADVWFRELSFSRLEQVVAAGPEAPAPNGFMVVLPADVGGKPSPTETQTWRIGKTMDISGEAVDHAALTGFLRRLAEQPAIADVRFLGSKARSGDGAAVTDFSLSAVTRVVKKAGP